MPPKLTKADVDDKLRQLRSYVIECQEELSARRATTLVKTLQQKKSAEEQKWYQFLTKKSAGFTQDQTEHLQETFALLRPANLVSSDGVRPRSITEATVATATAVPLPRL